MGEGHPRVIDRAAVLRPGVERVDRRETPGVGAGVGEAEEGADHLERGLGHRLLEVAAGRAHRPADGQRSGAPVPQPHDAAALVEARDRALQVGRERLLAGDLLEAPAHLAQRLRPARGGIRQQQHVQAELPVVLAQGHRGVDRGLAGGHRHARGVADDDGPLHQRAAGARVLQLRELLQQLHDLAGALAAGGDDDDVDVGVPAGELLQDRLARAEGAGDAVGPPLHHREKTCRRSAAW